MIKNIIKNYFSDKYGIKIYEFISLLFNLIQKEFIIKNLFLFVYNNYYFL